MGKITDKPVVPGDMVMVRALSQARIWRNKNSSLVANFVGTAKAETIGLVISKILDEKQWVYVLWSDPLISGWTYDGYLKVVPKEKDEKVRH